MYDQNSIADHADEAIVENEEDETGGMRVETEPIADGGALTIDGC